MVPVVVPAAADARPRARLTLQTASGAFNMVRLFFMMPGPTEVDDPRILHTVGGVQSLATAFSALALERYTRAVLGD